jgi:hypothetical protein
MNRRECWQPCWPYTPARETREQPSIAPTMPTNTAQSDPTEPLKTADLPLRYAENGASAIATPIATANVLRGILTPVKHSRRDITPGHHDPPFDRAAPTGDSPPTFVAPPIRIFGRIVHPLEAPERSLDQRMDALSRANQVRTLRAQLKRDLKAGRVSIGALLLDPSACLEAAKVFDMLLAVPKVGSVKATKILNSCRVSPSKTFGGLSERQRAELAERQDRS